MSRNTQVLIASLPTGRSLTENFQLRRTPCPPAAKARCCAERSR